MVKKDYFDWNKFKETKVIFIPRDTNYFFSYTLLLYIIVYSIRTAHARVNNLVSKIIFGSIVTLHPSDLSLKYLPREETFTPLISSVFNF